MDIAVLNEKHNKNGKFHWIFQKHSW